MISTLRRGLLVILAVFPLVSHAVAAQVMKIATYLLVLMFMA